MRHVPQRRRDRNGHNVREPARSAEQQASMAAFYGLYLVNVEGLSPDEAKAIVRLRYPRVKLPERRVEAETDTESEHPWRMRA